MGKENLNVIHGIFEWFNNVMDKKPGASFTREQVAEHFTSDAKMIANGQTKCAGIEAHLAHFIEMQKKFKSMRVRIPVEYSVSGDDKVAAYYKIDYTTADGSPGLVHDSALWKVRDNKIALMVETVAFEGKEVPLDNHK